MNYKILVTDEAADDIFNLIRYIHTELCNPDAAEKLYYNPDREIKNMGDFPLNFSDSGIKYRGYTIHKKVFGSYLIFYIISREKQEIYVLRVLKDLMDWQSILGHTKLYHFTNYQKTP